MMNYELAVIAEKLADLKKLQNEIDELTALADSLKDEIKTAMGDDTELRCGPFKVTYKTVIQNRFDSKAFKADHPEMYTLYTKPQATRPFKVA